MRVTKQGVANAWPALPDADPYVASANDKEGDDNGVDEQYRVR